MNRVLLAALQVQKQFVRLRTHRVNPDKTEVYKAAGNERVYNKVKYYKP